MKEDTPLTFKNAWRPLIAWLFIVAAFAMVALSVYTMIDGTASIGDWTPVLTIIFVALASAVTFYVQGRTKEKLKDKTDDSVLVGADWSEDNISGRPDLGGPVGEEPLYPGGDR